MLLSNLLLFSKHCGKRMSRADSKKKLEQSCQGDIVHVCPKYNKRCATALDLKERLQWHYKTQNSMSLTTAKAFDPITPISCPVQTASSTPAQATQYRCRWCTHVFDNRHELYLHGTWHLQLIQGRLAASTMGWL